MKKPIHVQHVLLSLQPGGLENGVVNIVNHLSPERFRSSICCLKTAGEFAARISDRTTIDEMGWRGGNDPMLLLRLIRLFRRTRPDIVHTRNVESFFYGFVAAKLAGVSCIVHSEHGRNFDDRAMRFHVQRWFSGLSQGVFTVSAQLKQELVAHVGMPADSVAVLYNGVDLDRFGTGDRARMRAALGLAEDVLVIGSVGRLVPVKNYPLLLQAVAALDRRDVVLVLVGDGPERIALEALAASLSISQQVRFLGHRNDVTDLLSTMDIFVLPSLNEGMSNTLLEAMAAGIPSIASYVGGNPELISHERDGFLFSSGDVLALTRYLQILCSDGERRAAFGAAGRARMVREFSFPAMVARYEKFYLDSLARRATAA
jgi:sugar transferase (PEP-CTERM/EpsH1 system associated)